MYTEYLNEPISIDLLHVGQGVFEEDISYTNIISTFSRIYFVQEEGGEIILGNKSIRLEKGYIYLIPGFEPCSYMFKKGMSHYFIHSTLILDKRLSPYNLFTIRNKIPSIPIDEMLFERLLEINPKIDIPHHDPNIYEKKLWMNHKLSFIGFNHYLETSGIIKQLFSRFIDKPIKEKTNRKENINLQDIFSFIKKNIDKDISVQALAKMSCLSTDHFSKLFKSAVGVGPCEFILRQRLQTAQLFLLTTNMNLQEISQAVNFKNLSYFSYIFKKHYKISPSIYRRQRET